MKRYLVQEEYREDVKGVRVVLVEAESKEAVIEDGDYEVLDIVEELDASAECYQTSLVDDVQFQWSFISNGALNVAPPKLTLPPELLIVVEPK